jgi:1,5-anhydro-D-fructose reductase (1,5-anhydro-D-mannitol-forming)
VRPVKIAVLSFAHPHATAYARSLAGRQDVDLVTSDPDGAAASDSALRGRELAESCGVAYLDTYQEVFDWKPDGVIVCSENANHRALAERAAQMGAHILCEKPLAITVPDATRLVAAANDAGVWLMTAYPVRFSSAVGHLKALIDRGRLGTILSVSGVNNGWLPTDERRWFVDKALSGGGALVDHVVHCADIYDLLLEQPVRSVHAATNRVIDAGPACTVETGGLVTLIYDNGVIATIDCSWSQPRTAPTWGGLTVTVTGTKGSVTVDPFRAHVGGFDANGALWLPYGQDLDAAMLDEFITAIREGRQPRPDGLSGVRTLEIVAAAQRSAESGQPELL